MRVPAGRGAVPHAIRLRMGTANVLSSLDAERTPAGNRRARAVGIRVTGRANVLARMFDQADLAFVGVQESRSQSEEDYRVGSYLVLSAPATVEGKLGSSSGSGWTPHWTRAGSAAWRAGTW